MESHSLLRQVAFEELSTNRQRYEEYAPEEGWEKFLHDFPILGTHQGELAIRALVNRFRVRIIVYQVGQNNLEYSPVSHQETAKVIEIAYLYRIHYDLIVSQQTQIEPNIKVPSDEEFEDPLLPEVDVAGLLENELADEAKCITWLKNEHIVPETYICPSCQGKMELIQAHDSKSLGKYRCSACSEQLSVNASCFLHRMHLPLNRVVKLLLTWLQNKPRNTMKEDVGCSLRSVIRHVNIFNIMASHLYVKNASMLGSNGNVVEIDECNLPRSKYNRGRFKLDCWVLGLIERPKQPNEIPKLVLLSLPDRTGDTLLKEIQRWVSPGSTIVTDAWGGYNGLSDHGYNHHVVCHKESFVNHETLAHTQRIESMWRWVRKNAVPPTGCSSHVLDYYLNAFLYKRQMKGNFLQVLKEFFGITSHELHHLYLKKKAFDADFQSKRAHEKLEKLEVANIPAVKTHSEHPAADPILLETYHTDLETRIQREALGWIMKDPDSEQTSVSFNVQEHIIDVEKSRIRNIEQKKIEEERNKERHSKITIKRTLRSSGEDPIIFDLPTPTRRRKNKNRKSSETPE